MDLLSAKGYLCFLITLSRSDTAFLLRSKHLLISWLQSLSTVILKPKKMKSATVSTFSPIYLPWSDGTGCHDLSFLHVEFLAYTHNKRKQGLKQIIVPPCSVQFSHSVVSNSLQPHGLQHTRPSCPSPTPGVHSNSCPLSQWCHPTISSSVVPFSSHLQSFPASGSFPMSQLFTSGGQSIEVSASTSVLPMKIQDWFPLGWTGWISLQSKGLSRVFSNTAVQQHQFLGAQLPL